MLGTSENTQAVFSSPSETLQQSLITPTIKQVLRGNLEGVVTNQCMYLIKNQSEQIL